jgi:hypothetical protein
MTILGPDGLTPTEGFSTGGLIKKKPIIDMRIVVYGKMMVHPQTKQMVMVPMQDLQYKREGSNEWVSMPIEELDKHEPNLEIKNEEVSINSTSGVILS